MEDKNVRDIDGREAAYQGMLEILNPVAAGVRSMEEIQPAKLISEALEERNWTVDKFVDNLFFYTLWQGSSRERSEKLLCDLLAGTKRIDKRAASMLSIGFGKPATYWLELQAAYDKASGVKQ